MVINFFESLNDVENCSNIVKKFLGNIEFWGKDLNSVPGLNEQVNEYYNSISKIGMSKAIAELLKTNGTAN